MLPVFGEATKGVDISNTVGQSVNSVMNHLARHLLTEHEVGQIVGAIGKIDSAIRDAYITHIAQ